MTSEAYAALSKSVGTQITAIDYRGSFAMIGFSKPNKPSFVKQVCPIEYIYKIKLSKEGLALVESSKIRAK